MKLPPVWGSKSTTPVKAKTSAPAPAPPSADAALTRCGLLSSTHTGSRERGGGLRQTLKRQADLRERFLVGRWDASGTVWATPLEHTSPTLMQDCAVCRSPNEAW